MGYFKKLSRKMLGDKKEILKTEVLPEHEVLVEQARHEWQAAQSLFNHVREKDLIDHAIFKLNAAERRYIFLLDEARRLQTDGHVQQRLNNHEQLKKGVTPDGGK